MGNRAIVYVKDSPAATYLHWNGGDAVKWLLEAAPRMRKGDASYSAARLTGCFHDHLEGNLALGLIEPPKAEDASDSYENYSHGDAGVVIVDCDNGTAKCYAGSLAHQYPDGIAFDLPS